jgi:hypothetical protein
MFLLEEHLVETVMKAIYAAGRFDKPGTGIAFVLPVDQASGLESQMESFKNTKWMRTSLRRARTMLNEVHTVFITESKRLAKIILQKGFDGYGSKSTSGIPAMIAVANSIKRG